MYLNTEQCSQCRRVRFYGKQGWSYWMKELPKSIKTRFHQVSVCNNQVCIKLREAFIAQTHEGRNVKPNLEELEER